MNIVLADYTELRDVLPQFSERKQYTVYLRLKRAIREGQWRALPTAEWLDLPRKGAPLRVPNLLIEGVLDSWIKDTLAEFSGQQAKVYPYVVTTAQLPSGEVDFKALAQQYRASLQPKRKKQQAKRRKPKAVKKSEAR